ncbi:fatty acid desaturase family protein [Jiangella alkaliphila]|uniref:Fatty acid desaturase n=1 Tax=Jiangella alkaliphila TaxID=419479 RepID=A0A1H2J0S9_9ACTN|nr:acyl-CoA desaturase [Jiangella alkaliphila]SDU49922.1 Fatty acid desaturase [Jiangella alkaliphila]
MTSETDIPAAPRPGSDFARLSRKIADAGLLDRRPGYYAVRIGIVVAAYAASWSIFAAVGDSWWTLAVAALLAVVFAQVALVAHDLAHRQVFRRRRPSEIAGRLAGNLGIGMSYGWWQDKHTRHHANPNHEDLDPDVSPDILVWSERQAGKAGGLTRVIAARQAFLFFPLLTLEGFNLHVAGVRATLDPRLKQRRLELGLLLAHFAGYLAIVFSVLSPGKAIAFIVLHQALFGIYLGCTFAPNHKGMPTLTAEDELDYLRKQVLTSRNVSGGALMDVALGGLNHQIEHHLFPNMPTPNLRKAKPIVRQYCAALGVSYAETTLIGSYRIALRHMHDVGEPLRSHAQ